ncbi:hypothetical protein RYX36_021177 [Vicia faba]
MSNSVLKFLGFYKKITMKCFNNFKYFPMFQIIVDKFLSILRSYNIFGRMVHNWFGTSNSQIMNEKTNSVVGKRVLSSRSTSNSTPSAWKTLEKRPTFQTQSRSDFLKNLSRKSSSNNASRVLEENDVISCTAPSSRDSINEEQQYRTKFILSSEEEEIAFLRSLGWEEDNQDDECLTEEEIQEFYDKYGKLQRFGRDGAKSDNHISVG